jgi:hypothetical protein
MKPIRTLGRVVLLAYTASGCAQGAAGPAGPASPRVDTLRVVDTVRVQTQSAVNTDLENQVARLHLQMLERDVLLRGLQEQLDAARQEVVRNMAKLQSQASRAEAASGMAEAEIALETLGRVEGGQGLAEHTEARELIAESTTEFNAENYGGALYLATQARTIARTGQTRLRGSGESLRAGESLFALPVPLRTTGRTNVRGGPSLQADVLFTLDGGLPVVGQSYTSQWVRVVDDAGRDGWIFHTLLSGR